MTRGTSFPNIFRVMMRGTSSEKMKELKKMYEMIEELEVAAETVRIEDAVCKNQVRYRCHACSFSIKPSLLKNAWVLFIHHTELTVLPFL